MKFYTERTSNKVPSPDRQPIAGAVWDELLRAGWHWRVQCFACWSNYIKRTNADPTDTIHRPHDEGLQNARDSARAWREGNLEP